VGPAEAGSLPRGVGRVTVIADGAVASRSGQRRDQHHWLRLSERTARWRGGGPTDHDKAASPHPLPGPRQPADMRGSRLRDDAELLQRHVDGDPDAFGSLFQRHRDRLWAVAIRTLGDPEEAADALQDAMIAAFRRASSFRGDSAVTTWLHRIVVNAALDRMRRRAARPTTSGQDDEALDALATVGGSRPLSDPSGTTDTSMDVMAALRRLVPDQQAALVLVDMLGYSIADAAEVLGVSEGTVKSRAARGRARLVPQLAHLRPAEGTDQQTGNQTARPRVQPAQEGGDDAL
jgi:RNA polymerase sigma-70 factor, ECF subfamily